MICAMHLGLLCREMCVECRWRCCCNVLKSFRWLLDKKILPSVVECVRDYVVELSGAVSEGSFVGNFGWRWLGSVKTCWWGRQQQKKDNNTHTPPSARRSRVVSPSNLTILTAGVIGPVQMRIFEGSTQLRMGVVCRRNVILVVNKQGCDFGFSSFFCFFCFINKNNDTFCCWYSCDYVVFCYCCWKERKEWWCGEEDKGGMHVWEIKQQQDHFTLEWLYFIIFGEQHPPDTSTQNESNNRTIELLLL